MVVDFDFKINSLKNMAVITDLKISITIPSPLVNCWLTNKIAALGVVWTENKRLKWDVF